MSSSPKFDDALREAIIQRPDVILDDPDLMQALIAANDRAMGSNIVDLRGIAMDRMEHRLGRLEDTHRTVIAAAYENLAGTNQVHRAVLRLLEPASFDAFLRTLARDVADILRVDALRLVLEAADPAQVASTHGSADVLFVTEPGFVDAYVSRGRRIAPHQVTLRQVDHDAGQIYGTEAGFLRSEACLRLDLHESGLPGLLLLGSEDPGMFSPQHGTDLLGFLAGVCERTMRRWLA